MNALRAFVERHPFVMRVLTIYAACRVVSTAILFTVAQRQVPTGMTGGDDVPVTFWNFLALWDGQWYQRIATEGYPSELPVGESGKVGENAWAFYPIFPMAARLLMGLGLSFPVAGGLIALACGFAAAVFMGLLLRDRIGTQASYAVVALWASFPASVTLQLAYTESLAMLLLCAYLYMLARERWIVATWIAVLTGLARPIAVPLGLVTLVAVVMRWRRRGERPISRGEYASMLAALAGCGVAGFIWPAIAAMGTGVRTAYFDTMAAWRAYDSVQPIQPWIDKAHYYFGDTWGPILLILTPILLAVMMLGPWAARLGPQLQTWALAYPAYLALVLDPFTSIFRYLVPMFPFLAVMIGAGTVPKDAAVRSGAGSGESSVSPEGDWRDIRPNRSPWIVAVPLLILFVIGQWYWTDILWRFDPPSDYPP